MAKSKAEKIADIELQMTQLENQRKKLLQQQKEQENKQIQEQLKMMQGEKAFIKEEVDSEDIADVVSR